MISLANLRMIADRESNFNAISKNLEDRMTEIAEQGGYYIEYSDSDVDIVSRLRRYFECLNFEVSQRSGTKIVIYWW
jgi:hypothetical protein